MRSKSILAFIIFIGFSISAFLPQAPPVKGIGVVVKRNPNGTRHKIVTDENGIAGLALEPGSYSLSLDQKDIIKSISSDMSKMIGKANPKKADLLLQVGRNPSLKVSQGSTEGYTDVINIEVLKPAKMSLTLYLDIDALQKIGWQGHVTLLK
jgi:hypothetical protein